MRQRIFNIRRPPEPPKKLKWIFANEPVLLEWTIRARNYNTLVANTIFYLVGLFHIGITVFLYELYDGMRLSYRILACVFCFSVMIYGLTSMTHQTVNVAYRVTPSGIEYCKWKDFPEGLLTFLKWLTGISLITLLFMTTIDPSFLIAAVVGPGGMALSCYSMAHSKSYREMHTEYNHNEFHWCEITQVAIATNREVVDIRYQYTPEGTDCISNWNFNIFCHRKQKEHVASVLKPYLLPGTPFIRAKVDVPLSTVK